jgi:hypothetical protein
MNLPPPASGSPRVKVKAKSHIAKASRAAKHPPPQPGTYKQPDKAILAEAVDFYDLKKSREIHGPRPTLPGSLASPGTHLQIMHMTTSPKGSRLV